MQEQILFTFATVNSRMLQVHLALFTVSLLYALTFTVAKEVMNGYVHPSAFIVIRVSVAALLFTLLHGLFVRERLHTLRDLKPLFISALFGVGFNMLLFFNGLHLTTPINGAVLMTCTPIFVVILASFFLNERITLSRGAGILLAAVGAAFLIGGWRFNFTSSTALGDLMVMVNAIIYSYYLVYTKPLLQRYKPLTVSKWTFLAGVLITLPFGAGPLREVNWPAIPGYIYGYMLFVAVGSTFLTYLLNAWALRYATPALVGSYIYLQPVLAALIAIISGRDTLTVAKFSYTLLIFAGVYLVSKPTGKHA